MSRGSKQSDVSVGLSFLLKAKWWKHTKEKRDLGQEPGIDQHGAPNRPPGALSPQGSEGQDLIANALGRVTSTACSAVSSAVPERMEKSRRKWKVWDWEPGPRGVPGALERTDTLAEGTGDDSPSQQAPGGCAGGQDRAQGRPGAPTAVPAAPGSGEQPGGPSLRLRVRPLF